MFDKTFILPRPRAEAHYVAREVHEHRAPTDESVRLLREMEAAADARRVASFKLEGNSITGAIEVYQQAEQGYVLFARAVFDVNGKRCTAKTWIDGTKSDGPRKIELMQALHAEITKAVASEVLGECMKGMAW
jgi:hypothetical protein